MAELVIARITENGVQTRDLSETFSGQNEIFIKGQQGNAGGTCVATLNGISLNPSNLKGLSCIHLSGDGIATPAVFDFAEPTSTTTFPMWVNGMNDGIILFMSHTENVTNGTINALFDSWGSVGWKYYWNPEKGTNRSSMVGILDCKLKKLMSEQYMGHGKTTPPAQLSVVYDTFADIGTTGYGDTIVWDENEFISAGGSDYMVKSFINSGSLGDFQAKIGETIEITAELMHDDICKKDGQFSALIIQYWNAGAYISGDSITSAYLAPFEWGSRSVQTKIPPNTTHIEISLYRITNNTNGKGKIGVRDVTVKLCKPAVYSKTGMGSIGQWGFITDVAKEADKPVATVDGKTFVTSSYESLDEEWLPDFKGGYFRVPLWQVSGDFEMSQTISYNYPRGGETWYRSGQASPADDTTETDRLEFGASTVNHGSGENHFFAWGDKSIVKKATLEYGKPYTYKISVVGDKATCYLDGVEQGVLTPTNKVRTFPSFFVGAEGRGNRANAQLTGSVHELNLIDLNDDRNSRYYNFVLAGQLDDDRKVVGRSRYSGKTYVSDNATPSPSNQALYCGPTSGAAQYGLQAGDEAFVTVLDAGGNELVGVVVGTRYKTKVIAMPEDGERTIASRAAFANPTTGNIGWIVIRPDGTQNANKMKVRVEYVAHPLIDADVTNVDWVNIGTKTYKFDGKTGVYIPTWKGPGEFSLKFRLNSYPKTNAYYLFDGRTVEDAATPCHIYVTNQIINGGGSNITIASVNGLPFVAGQMKVALDTDYHITGYIHKGGVSCIGGRHNDTEFLDGYIWDFSVTGETDSRYYKNVARSRFPAFSNSIKDMNATSDTVYKAFDINDWTLSSTVERVNSKAYKFNDTWPPSGIVYSAGLNPGDRYRIEYDIETSRPTEFRASGVINGSAPLIKALPVGRARGAVSFQHVPVTGKDGPGVYIRTISPRLNEVVKVRKLKITRVPTDGIGSNVTNDDYQFNDFVEPSMRTTGMKTWVPNFRGSNTFIDIPTWTPDANNFRIRVDFRLGVTTEMPSPIISGAKSDLSTINLDIYTGTNLRFFGYDANKNVIDGVTIPHGLKVGDVATVVVDVVDGTATVTINGKSKSCPWTKDQSCNVKMIGARDTGARYNSDIFLVELIDTSTEKCNHRRYDLTRRSSVLPTTNIIPNDVKLSKQLRIDTISTSPNVTGWDRTLPKEAGRLKDTWAVDGYKLAKFTSINTTGYSAYLKFENNARPFNSIDIELYSVDDLLVGTFNANQAIDGLGYGIPESDIVAKWFDEVNANKKIVFIPRGDGANSVIVGPSWVEL